jgi:hypothetical protein
MQLWRIVVTIQGWEHTDTSSELYENVILRLLKDRYRASRLATRTSQIGRMAPAMRPCSCPNFDDLIQCLASEGEGLRRDLPPRVPLCGAGSPK